MAQPSQPSLSERPRLIFDGDCALCRVIVDRWRDATNERIEFLPYQDARSRFPEISERDFRRSVHLIDCDGTVSRGAQAVFQSAALCGRKRWLHSLYERVPPFALAAETIYRVVAANRGFISVVRRIWWGQDLKRPTYHIASALFLRLLGLVYLCAFVSLWTQIGGLVGAHGILPVQNFLPAVAQHFSQQVPPESPTWNLPTLAWLGASDSFLKFLCGAGTVLSVMLIVGLLPIPTLVLLWMSYLSLFHVGQVFLGFQWDILLLEAGFLAIFAAPWTWRSKFLADQHPSRLAIWLVWWLLFRLMLESGAVKLTWNNGVLGPNGQPVANTWSSLTALDYHYWTQPLPAWTSWYAAQFPEWFQKLSVVFVLLIELALPWFIFGPRLLRVVAWAGITLLMLLISATGNYNFFNLLTIGLALPVLDDKLWPRFLQRRIRGTDWPVLLSPTRWRSALLIPLSCLVIVVGTVQVKQALAPSQLLPELPLESKLGISQFCLVNSYGLFRQMTETRPEILIEASANGGDWKGYEFYWKPGDLAQAPQFCALINRAWIGSCGLKPCDLNKFTRLPGRLIHA